jgi:hypothetical protein
MHGAPEAISRTVPSLQPAEIVRRLGPHPAARAGLDLSRDGDAFRWLALALLLASGADEERALAALRALPESVAGEDPVALAAVLTRERVTKPEPVAATLVRAARAFDERWRGSLARLASEADDLETLGSRLTALAPGVGRATVLRFLRPLRDQLSAAREVPLTPAARAAAIHLGWITAGDDEEGEPVSLRARIARDPDAPPFADVEAALERLGSASCLRDRALRCPLEADCPRRP